MSVPPYAYRADGWPLCPNCEDDELMSMAATTTDEAGTPRRPQPTDRMTCLRCQWNGVVPPRDRGTDT